MNKEVNDALHFLLHCALKDKEFDTQKKQFFLVHSYITRLESSINRALILLKHSYTGLDVDKVIEILERGKQ